MPTRLRRVPDRFQGPALTRAPTRRARGSRKTPFRWSLYFFNSLLIERGELADSCGPGGTIAGHGDVAPCVEDGWATVRVGIEEMTAGILDAVPEGDRGICCDRSRSENRGDSAAHDRQDRDGDSSKPDFHVLLQVNHVG